MPATSFSNPPLVRHRSWLWTAISSSFLAFAWSPVLSAPQGAPGTTMSGVGQQRAAGDMARAQTWIRLVQALGEIPQPPNSVSEASRYDRQIEPKLEALQQELEHWEAQLESSVEDLDEETLPSAFAETLRQGGDAQQRLAARTGPASDVQNTRETATMRSTLPAQFEGFDSGQSDAALLSLMQSTTTQKMQEEQQMERLKKRHSQEMNACNAPDTACSAAADRAHYQRVSAYKNPIYRRTVFAWNSTMEEMRMRAEPIERGIRKLAEAGRWLLGRSGDQQAKPLDIASQSRPVRWLTGMFAALLGISKDRWEEAKSYHEIQSQSSNDN